MLAQILVFALIGVSSIYAICPTKVPPFDCNQPGSECLSGDCVPGGSGYYCKCWSGYEGKRCEDDINECSNRQAQCNGGDCVNLPGSYKCENCPLFQMGEHCELHWDDCRTLSCDGMGYGHANCVPGDSIYYKCVCQNGWSGEKCNVETATTVSTSAPDCTNDPSYCGAQGSCVQGVCQCDPRFTGPRCNEDFNECAANSNICNGGTCVNNWGGFSCQNCPANKQGDRCENAYEDCRNNGFGCNGQGLCQPGSDPSGPYSCHCNEGYSGPYCETMDPR